jgi:hypothetical protein
MGISEPGKNRYRKKNAAFHVQRPKSVYCLTHHSGDKKEPRVMYADIVHCRPPMAPVRIISQEQSD